MKTFRGKQSEKSSPNGKKPLVQACLPGSEGEHLLQARYGTASRAESFYHKQVLDRLNDSMKEFISRQTMMFLATSDAHGECDCSFRAGLPGFVQVLDDQNLIYPEYRGNGVLACLGNIHENGHAALFFIDFLRDTIGLHVNGSARIVENAELLELPDPPKRIREDLAVQGGRKPERWVRVTVEEAYVHCSKHIPHLAYKDDKTIHWGTDDARLKGGNYFHVADGDVQPPPES